MIRINGEDREISRKNLAEFIKEEGYDIKKIAIEKNGDIVPKIYYDKTFIEDGDTLEIVNFVGGG